MDGHCVSSPTIRLLLDTIGDGLLVLKYLECWATLPNRAPVRSDSATSAADEFVGNLI
jgi:hypothetical protein